MNAITYSEAKANLAKTMDRVCDDHEAVIVARHGGRSVVLMSLEDYNSMIETFYPLRNVKNAVRITESIKRLDKGLGQERKLID